MPEAVESCPICQEKQAEVVEAFADSRLTTNYEACAGCGLVRMNPRPTARELDEFYRDTYWKEWGVGGVDAKRRKQARRAGFIASFLKRQFPALSERAARPSILEVASSFGMTLDSFRKALVTRDGQEPRLYGIEPSEVAVSSSPDAYRNIELVGRDIRDLPTVGDTRFDVIVLSHVLEHFTDPVESLGFIARFLAPGGAFYIEVPNYYGHPSVEYAHNYCFTVASFSNCVRAAGLETAALEETGHDEAFPFYLSSLVVSATGGDPRRDREDPGEVRQRRSAAKRSYQALRQRNARPDWGATAASAQAKSD